MVRALSRPELQAAASNRAEQRSQNAPRRVWKAVENLCLPCTIGNVSALQAVLYVIVDNSWILRRHCPWQSVEVAARRPHDGIQKTFQIVGVVKGDSHDPAVVVHHLHLDVRLEALTELILDAP